MKLSKDFIAHQSGDDFILVPTGTAKFSGIVKGNSTFGFIVESLKNDTSESEIVSALLEKFDAPEDVIKNNVNDTINKLQGINAIEF